MANAQPPPRPWLPPGTASTWICQPGGHINPRTSTVCSSCPRPSR
jgi:hypothetical protein